MDRYTIGRIIALGIAIASIIMGFVARRKGENTTFPPPSFMIGTGTIIAANLIYLMLTD